MRVWVTPLLGGPGVTAEGEWNFNGEGGRQVVPVVALGLFAVTGVVVCSTMYPLRKRDPLRNHWGAAPPNVWGSGSMSHPWWTWQPWECAAQLSLQEETCGTCLSWLYWTEKEIEWIKYIHMPYLSEFRWYEYSGNILFLHIFKRNNSQKLPYFTFWARTYKNAYFVPFCFLQNTIPLLILKIVTIYKILFEPEHINIFFSCTHHFYTTTVSRFIEKWRK